MQCLNFVAWTLWCLGYPDQALQRSHEALTLTRELAHPASQAGAMYGATRLRQLRRDVHEAHELAEALITFATEERVPYYLAMGTFLGGWALFHQGQREDGIERMHQGLAAMRATGGEVTRPAYLALLAEACGKAEQAERGLPLLAEARAMTDENGQRYCDADFHWLEGELLLQQAVPDASQAETCFHQALSIARHQQAKSWELRAAMSLARLWQSQDKRQDAYDLLAPVYNWFTEGFDTADLQDARALLDDLEGGR